MQKFRELLALILIALLPFHALAVTVFTRVVAGPNHAPLSVLALWKEGLLACVLLCAVVELVRARDRRPETGVLKRFDVIDGCIVILALALLVASLLVSGLSVSRLISPSFIYGIRYDIVPLAAFIVLRRVSWSDVFVRRVPIILTIAAAVAVAYGIVTLLVPDAFFRALGYSDLPSLYVPGGPIAAFQQIGGSALRRLQGPMSGPNQFGMWLAVALPFVLSMSRPAVRRILAPLVLLAILLTFSRAAWIATAVILAIALRRHILRLSVTAVTTLCIGTLVIAYALVLFFPSVILRVESSLDHIRNPLQAVSSIISSPVGHGLGTAGPANNRVADACVTLSKGSDPSWAAAHPQLCVFVGDDQVQPTDRACTCPFLPENWYLQIGVEGGWIAFGAFLALTLLMIRLLRDGLHPLLRRTFLAFLAVSIAALVLHAWEDAAVAYTVWILAAVALGIKKSPHTQN